MKKNNRPQFFIGVNPIVVKNNKLLLGKRKNIFGDNTWGLPGGHLEYGENVIKCAERELREETNLICKNFMINSIISQIQDGERHYLQIVVEALEVKGEIKVMEPDKCLELKWFLLNKLPKNIFKYHKEQIKNFLKTKKLK